MSDEDIIGFHRRLPPFKAKRMDWRRFPLLVQRHNLPHPEPQPLPRPESPQLEASPAIYIDPDVIN